jgi:NAD(P)-dependent dehydrogenase (short-subunit alcohol dehydrogenase family)
MKRFEGQIALVTGAGGGIGYEIARDLVREGALVHALDLKPAPEAFVDLPGLTYHVCDLRDQHGVAKILTLIEQRHDRLNLAVNGAGICLFERDGSFEAVDDAAFQLTMDVNLGGAIRVARGCMPLMRKAGGGAFVHVASVVGLRCMENIEVGGPADAYQVSKAALISLSRSMALQYAHEGIRSNTVCPGAIVTPMTQDIYQHPERVDAMSARTPMRRIGTPEDVSGAVLFLLSKEAAFITGVDLQVDGGLLAKL